MEQDVNSVISNRKLFRVKFKKEIVAYSILLIPLIWWGIFFIYAFVKAFALSFTDWSLSTELNFIGLQNYFRLFQDSIVMEALLNTVIWTCVMLVGVNFFGILVAALIIRFKSKAGSKIVLGALFWPTLVSAAASAEVQKFVLGENESGLINNILLNMRLIDNPIAWLSNPDVALIGLMIMPFFLGFGIKMIIYYTGMKNIPATYYEAAQLETNNSFMVFCYITLPLLRQVLMFNMVLSVIEGFKVIAPMQLITNGGPMNSTNSVLLAMYQYGFVENEMGYASSIAFVLFLIIMLFTCLQLLLDKEKISYE